MNTNIIRVGAAVLLFSAGWGFSSFIRSDSGSSSSFRFDGRGSGTPLPDTATGGKAAANLSSTAIGRLIEGKADFRRQASLHQYADSLDAAAMAGAVNEAMQLPLQYRNGALAVLFARWAELDPAAAAKYANLMPKSANPWGLRRTAMTAWAEKNFDEAFAWAQALEKGDAKNESLTTLAGVLAKKDPAAALKLIKENFNSREASNAYDSVFSAWAENDFGAALAAAQGLTDPQLRQRALRATLQKRVDTDPRAVLEVVRTAKVSDLRWNVGNNAINRWLERDMTAARDYVLGLPRGEMRDMQIRQVTQEMVRRDPQEALAWVDGIPEADREEAIQSLFSNWGNKDPDAAIAAARNLPQGRMQETALGQLAESLIESDVKTAMELLKDLPEGQARQNAMNQVGYRWARLDPAAAAEWIYSNDPNAERGSMHQVMWEWSRNDPEAALKWVLNLPESDRKGQMVGQVVSQMSRSDPATAAEQIEKLPIESQRSAVQNFVSNWTYRDPDAAAKWALSLRDATSQENAIGAVASQWGNRDPAATARWIEKLPAGAARDAAVTNFSYAASQTDPEGAVAWAVTIRDPDKQRNTVRNTYANWARKDPVAAANWMQSTNAISAETKAELQTMQPRAK